VLAQVANPAQVLKFGHVFAPQVPAGAHVANPGQVPKALHDGFGAHDATPAQVGLPGIVGTQMTAAQVAAPPQLGVGANVGGQFIYPGQVVEPSHVMQFAGRHDSYP
jgi:hypothetical protein